jgi:hypothetical protein
MYYAHHLYPLPSAVCSNPKAFSSDRRLNLIHLNTSTDSRFCVVIISLRTRWALRCNLGTSFGAFVSLCMRDTHDNIFNCEIDLTTPTRLQIDELYISGIARRCSNSLCDLRQFNAIFEGGFFVLLTRPRFSAESSKPSLIESWNLLCRHSFRLLFWLQAKKVSIITDFLMELPQGHLK